MNDQDLTQARTAVDSILNALGVARVVYVDDTNDEGVSLEDVIAAAVSLNESDLLMAFPEIGDVKPDDPDVLVNKVRSVWEQIDPNGRNQRGQAVLIAARRHDGDNTDDIADASIMSDLVAATKLLRLTPSQWETQKEQLLQDNKTHRMLFLFDRDFSIKGGDPEGGIKIIASLLARNDTERLICGLLTHTVKPETQPESWVELSRTHHIPKDRFVVIPKLYLSQDPILFAQTLKFAALSPDFDELKRKTKEIIAKAATAAAEQVDEVNIYDLDHIVFQVSADEGLWEPDMLFRLHALFHRLESRRLAHEGGILETIAAKLRAVSGIPMNGHLFSPPSSAWALQRKELYEFDDHINKNHLPLELGDIFERVGATSAKQYILLAQPCDLMVRGDGKRYPELRRLPLAEVVCTEKAPQYSEEMPYFDESPTKRWYVNLKQIYFVRFYILDLCVFNQDGIAKLNLAGDALPAVHPAWKARHRILARLCGQDVSKAEMLVPVTTDSQMIKQTKLQFAKKFDGLLFDDDLFKGKLIETDGIRSVTYDCKRVRRLSRSRALGLLMSYTSTIGRPAYDREFGGER
jgi:hypothetical protein